MAKLSIKTIIANLSCDAIEATSQSIDWAEARGEDGEGWVSYEAVECEKCGRVVVLDVGGGDKHCNLEPTVEDKDGDEIENECDGWVSEADGPMMNYWYPVEIDDCQEAAHKLVHLPLCVVEFSDGRTGLALTGGGMNLSWEICEAFIAIGYLPPVYFSDLPVMADKRLDEKNRLTLAACIRSNEVMRQRAAWNIDRLRRCEKELRAAERKRAERKEGEARE